jgi:ATP-dependent DNA helicase PIF1
MDHTYTSHKVLGDNATLYPTEFLNSINASGLPMARLALKPGCPLMLLRNIDPTNGLCNGTRMILLEIRPMVLRCRILGGDYAGNEVFIPRITIDPSDDLPVNLYRRQFPVRLAFVMTINKSQGQSIINVGIDLRSPVFSHGQLYVALSRCTSADRIKVVFPDDSDTTHTSNVVFTEVLAGFTNP